MGSWIVLSPNCNFSFINICIGIMPSRRTNKKKTLKLENLEEGEEFQIPSLGLDGVVIRQGVGSVLVKYYNYIDPFDEENNIKIIKQIISPDTLVRRR